MKTKSRRVIKNKTLKIKNDDSPCYKVYKPFIRDFRKTVSKDMLLKNHKQLMQTFVKKLHLKYAPSKITAQNDFYTYINYKWITNNEIDSTSATNKQGYITEYDDFRIVQDRVYWQLDGILKDYIKNKD